MEYLKGLSFDAIPDMEELLEDEEVGDEVLEHFKQKKLELQEQDVWQSLNNSRTRASIVIDRYIK